MMSTNDPFLRPIQPIGPKDQEKVTPTAAEELAIREDGRGEIKIFIPEEAEKLGGYLTFLFSFQEGISFLPSSFKGVDPTDPLTPLLQRLRLQLKELTEINQSKNTTYSLFLASIWNELLQKYGLITQGKLSSNLPLDEVYHLIQEIQYYPKDAKYSLGYYLSEYAGKSWFPFPYVELLEKLHQEHLNTPKQSSLQKWLNLLENLV